MNAPFPENRSPAPNMPLHARLGFPPPMHRIRTTADLFKIPQDRRGAACAALAAWLIDPNTRVKTSWFQLHWWLGQDVPVFTWEDDGKAGSHMIATIKVDAAEAIDIIRRAIVATVEQGGLPPAVLEAFDASRDKAEAPQRQAVAEAQADKAVVDLIHEYGLRLDPTPDGGTIYTAYPKLGSKDQQEKVTTIHRAKSAQRLEHLEAWLRHHVHELDTVSTLRRQLKGLPQGWYVTWVADAPGTTIGVHRLFQAVASKMNEGSHNANGLPLGNGNTTEFEALRIALGMFIDYKTLADARLRFADKKPAPLPFAGFPGARPNVGDQPPAPDFNMACEYRPATETDVLMAQVNEALAMRHGALVAGFRHGVMGIRGTEKQMAEPHFKIAFERGRRALADIDRRAVQELRDTTPADPALLVGHDGHKWPRTMDAVCWAKAWIAHITLYPDLAKDEGAMIGWFSNAIMAGYDTAEKRAAERENGGPAVKLDATVEDDPAPALAQYMQGWTSGARGTTNIISSSDHFVRGHRHGQQARQHAKKGAAWALGADTDAKVEAGPDEAADMVKAVAAKVKEVLIRETERGGLIARHMNANRETGCAYDPEKHAGPVVHPGPFPGNMPQAVAVVDGTGGKSPLQVMRDLIGIQGSDGNWNYSEYMLGLFNGMELGLSTMENREPVWRKMPETGWLADKPRTADEVVPKTIRADAVAAGMGNTQWAALISRRTGLPVEEEHGDGKNASTAPDVTGYMLCTERWPVDGSLVDDGHGGQVERLVIEQGTIIGIMEFDHATDTAITTLGLKLSLPGLRKHAREATRAEVETYKTMSGIIAGKVETDGAKITAAAPRIAHPEMRVAHWWKCTKKWNVRPGAVFMPGDSIELDGADFERGMVTLAFELLEVPWVLLNGHAEIMNPEDVQEELRKRGLADAPPLPETATLDAPGLQSENFETGKSGWQLSPAPVAAVEPPPNTRGHEAIQALEKANPNAPGLVGADAPRVEVYIGDVLGQFARFAILQSPYTLPDGLAEVLAAIDGDIQDRFNANGTAKLNFRDLENMLNEAIMALPQVSIWNQRQNGNASEFIDGQRNPHNQFIDLQALILNTATACIEDAHNTAGSLVATAQPPQAVDGESIGLWRYAKGDGAAKYLLLRRDGTVPNWPWFILGARDQAAVHAVAAYAWYAALLGYPAQFVADCERLAREMAAYRQEHGGGDPAASPAADRKDHSAIIDVIKAAASGTPTRVVGIAVEHDGAQKG